jgi:hypothetical protein
MAQNITSFSVPDSNPDGLILLTEVKTLCKNRGLSFSFVVLEGLKLWLKENTRARD